MAEKEMATLSFSVSSDREFMLDGLYGTGIDDLAKFRIVQYLQECSGPVDVRSISSYLGLHPIELVDEALESLTGKGILVREGRDPASYAVNCQTSLWHKLQRLINFGSPQQMESVFRALAASSLAKAQDRKRNKSRRGNS